MRNQLLCKKFAVNTFFTRKKVNSVNIKRDQAFHIIIFNGNLTEIEFYLLFLVNHAYQPSLKAMLLLDETKIEICTNFVN